MFKASANYKSESLKGIGTSTDLAFMHDRAKKNAETNGVLQILTPVSPLL